MVLGINKKLPLHCNHKIATKREFFEEIIKEESLPTDIMTFALSRINHLLLSFVAKINTDLPSFRVKLVSCSIALT